MKIRIKNDPKRAIISAPEETELSDEVKLSVIECFVSGLMRKLGVDEIEFVYESGESDEQL